MIRIVMRRRGFGIDGVLPSLGSCLHSKCFTWTDVFLVPVPAMPTVGVTCVGLWLSSLANYPVAVIILCRRYHLFWESLSLAADSLKAALSCRICLFAGFVGSRLLCRRCRRCNRRWGRCVEKSAPLFHCEGWSRFPGWWQGSEQPGMLFSDPLQFLGVPGQSGSVHRSAYDLYGNQDCRCRWGFMPRLSFVCVVIVPVPFAGFSRETYSQHPAPSAGCPPGVVDQYTMMLLSESLPDVVLTLSVGVCPEYRVRGIASRPTFAAIGSPKAVRVPP